MADDPITAELVPAVAEDRSLDHLCNFMLPDGSRCMRSRYVRGYCDSHYRALRRAGAFTDLTSKPRHDPSAMRANATEAKRARKALRKKLPVFVEHLALASENAARRGKADPAIWALLHGKVIEPVEKSAPSNVNTGTTINIGVKVSGIRRDE